MRIGRYNIKQLLNSSEIYQIIIPELQRDYVWGTRNVLGLLNSIFSNYNSRENLKLDIKLKGQNKSIEDELNKYLTLEYNKLKFNTRIGFLYAYHNPEYAGKYFLIDGQQRITTIYLLLLATYKKAEKTEQFKSIYFKNKEPKIDYQVRETSHDFLVDFIDFELNNNDKPKLFNDNNRFYDIYNKDKTVQTITCNYNFILDFISNNITQYEDFIEYIENFIEFNYFDTNLSEQGERLYLYMNSRGESLSDQEMIKSLIVQRSNNKLKAGELWEDWQNFFWKHRNTNDNADAGIFEFLKWSVILHMDKFPGAKLKELEEKQEGKNQTETERKEDYIKQTKAEEQPYWIKKYIIDNDTFDIAWLEKVMKAIKNLDNLEDYNSDINKLSFLPTPWLSSNINTIDYSPICGTIKYLLNYNDAGDRDIYSIGMYIKNLCSGYNNRRNPDNTVLRVLRIISIMKENEIQNIRHINNESVNIDDKNVFRKDDLRFKLMSEEYDNWQEWEEFFWKITQNKDLNLFLRGNHNPIIKLFIDDAPTIESAEYYLKLFKEKIYDNRNSDNLRVGLLNYGDISVDDYGGSWNFGSWLHRFNLLTNDNDENAWNVFIEKNESIVIIKKYLDKSTETTNNIELLALAKAVKKMKQKKYLWNDDEKTKSRCIILKEHQASYPNSHELPVYLLHKEIKGSHLYEYKTCYINFEVINKEFIPFDNFEGKFYIDIIYNYYQEGGNWKAVLGFRNKSISEEIVNYFINNDVAGIKWEAKPKDEYTCLETSIICEESKNDDLVTSYKEVYKWFNKFKEEVSEIL